MRDDVRRADTAFVAARSSDLLRAAAHLTADPHRAEDLLQVALTKAYLAWPARRGDPYAYARRVLATSNVDAWRARRWREEPHADPGSAGRPGSSVDSSDEVQRLADRDLLLEVLAEISARERTVLVLRYGEDLSEAATADVLGVSVGTVTSTASRALAKLRARTLPTPVEERP